jgi:hypothetical protein
MSTNIFTLDEIRKLILSHGKKLILLHGNKGGVGKSTNAGCIQHFLPQAKCIDGDSQNSDFARIIGKEVALVDLRIKEGWYELMNQLEGVETDVIVSMPAGCDPIFTKEIKTIKKITENSGLDIVVLWLMNRQRDSIEMLRLSMDSAPVGVQYIAVLNGYFGETERFSLWNESKFRQEFLTQRGGKEVYFPPLFDVIADKLSRYAVTYEKVMEDKRFTLGDRANILEFLDNVESEMMPVILSK